MDDWFTHIYENFYGLRKFADDKSKTEIQSQTKSGWLVYLYLRDFWRLQKFADDKSNKNRKVISNQTTQSKNKNPSAVLAFRLSLFSYHNYVTKYILIVNLRKQNTSFTLYCQIHNCFISIFLHQDFSPKNEKSSVDLFSVKSNLNKAKIWSNSTHFEWLKS